MGCHFFQPRFQAGSLLALLLQDGTRTLHEYFSQIAVPPFTDSQQLLLAAGGVFSGNHPHPGCELSRLAEGSNGDTVANPPEGLTLLPLMLAPPLQPHGIGWRFGARLRHSPL